MHCIFSRARFSLARRMMMLVAMLLLLDGGITGANAKSRHSSGSHAKSRTKAATASRNRDNTSSSSKKSAATTAPIPPGKFSTVVIDAGHGGWDLGGIPENIIPEKNVTLDVAQRLEKALQAAGLQTVMTRNDDTFVTLNDRVTIANAHPEAVFLSVHFNSGLRVAARGIETYYSSPSGAALARLIQRNLIATTTGENRAIKRAMFWVLRKTKIRSVLVECGFLTNPEDVALAQDAGYRQKLADQICAAIIEYRDSLP